MDLLMRDVHAIEMDRRLHLLISMTVIRRPKLFKPCMDIGFWEQTKGSVWDYLIILNVSSLTNKTVIAILQLAIREGSRHINTSIKMTRKTRRLQVCSNKMVTNIHLLINLYFINLKAFLKTQWYKKIKHLLHKMRCSMERMLWIRFLSS